MWPLSCAAEYCSQDCQKAAWSVHKKECKAAARKEKKAADKAAG